MFLKIAIASLLLLGLSEAYWGNYQHDLKFYESPNVQQMALNNQVQQEQQKKESKPQKEEQTKQENGHEKHKGRYEIYEWGDVRAIKFSHKDKEAQPLKSIPVLLLGYKLVREDEEEQNGKLQHESDQAQKEKPVIKKENESGQMLEAEQKTKKKEEPMKEKEVLEYQEMIDHKEPGDVYHWYKWY